jgi:glucose dehydrogenase
MRTGNLRRPLQAGSAVWHGSMRTGQALAATMLMLFQGPAHGAEELIEMSRDDPHWVMPAENYVSTLFSGLDYGTANPGPWNHNQRLGDNKWTASIFARDPDTGMARWAYQWGPHDLYDYDGINENTLIDGAQRNVLVRPERMYVMDRATGEVLSAEPYQDITVTRGIDLETGRLIEVEEKEPRENEVMREICPAAPGTEDWQPSAFSPQTGLVYVPHQHLCMDMKPVETSYIAGTPFVGAEVEMYAGPAVIAASTWPGTRCGGRRSGPSRRTSRCGAAPS